VPATLQWRGVVIGGVSTRLFREPLGPRRSLHRLGFEGSGVNGWAILGMWGLIRGKDALLKGLVILRLL
jgi:hypothetical protein